MMPFNNNKHKSKIKLNITSVFSVIIIFLMICLIVSPLKYINAATYGIMLWADNLLPALFPFFVLSKMLIDLNFFDKFTHKLTPIMEKCFGVNGSASYIFCISILSGYPLGSKLVLDAFNSKKINQIEAFRLTSITSVSGPLFIIGTVGTSMLQNTICGYIMIIAHILGALLNGLTYKKYLPKNLKNITTIQTQNKNNKTNILTDAISSSIESLLVIGGLVCVFYVGIQAINTFVPVNAIIQGLIEITNGCNQISISSYPLILKTIICCAVITFGGLCTHAQAMFFLKQCNITYSFFVKQKITHTIYSSIICAILCLCFIN